MSEKTISVSLDEEALRALTQLTSAGASRSEAIRRALQDAARTAWRERATSRRQANRQRPVDRAVIAEVRAFFDEIAPLSLS
jgi:Arc/MetJ-type ribon-helix-helix transcriptional regulator